MDELVCVRAASSTACGGRLEIIDDPWILWVGSGEHVPIVLCREHCAEAEAEV